MRTSRLCNQQTVLVLISGDKSSITDVLMCPWGYFTAPRTHTGCGVVAGAAAHWCPGSRQADVL